MSATDTIFALSSGAPPAAIAVVRVSGPDAFATLEAMAGRLPELRRASLMRLVDPEDRARTLDDALVLRFAGPASATGEDLVELHLHGGRAVVAAVEAVLARFSGLRMAEAGEFMRRAFANGRIDLSAAEGLADLLTAETALQLANARALANGVLSRHVDDWRDRTLALSALVETVLDFADEDDSTPLADDFFQRVELLARDMSDWLAAPSVETLREGFRVAIAGPPNSGKSSLFNALIQDDAAISTPIAGTTRDVLLRPVAISGVPMLFVDTAGLRDDSTDVVERIGIDRARLEMERADLVLWLGDEGFGPDGAWDIESMIDRTDRREKSAPDFRVSAATGENVATLRRALVEKARSVLPKPGQVAISRFQRDWLGRAFDAFDRVRDHDDALLIAEELRSARSAFDRLTGRAATEDMLDALFGRFCIGK